MIDATDNQPAQTLEIVATRGAEIAHWLPQLAALRIRVFREFPYLYDGSEEYERTYLYTYVNSDTSIAILALDGDEVVGASTGLALRDEDDAFVRPFAEAGYDPDTVFYCAESVLLPAYRGRGISRSFFNGRESHARGLPGMELISFCAVDRPVDHPRRPADYVPLDRVWARFGYRRRDCLRTSFDWRDLDEACSSPKPMVFYTKLLNRPG